MKIRNLILLAVVMLCATNGMAQGKRTPRKRPAKQSAVRNSKQTKTDDKIATLPAQPAVGQTVDTTTTAPVASKAPVASATPAPTAAPATPTTPVAPTSSKPAAEETVAEKTAASPLVLPPPAPVVPKDRVDTIYYSKDWKVMSNKAFASYYRYALYPTNPNMAKVFKTYYINGMLQSEGSFLELDKNDDANSKFADSFVSYYKDGNVEEKKNYVDGKLDGEYITYYNNGNICKRFLMSEGTRNGLAASFTEDGKVCTLTPYKYDQAEGYYVVVDIDGNYSKYSLADKQLMLEKPNPSELMTEYKNGVAWPYYNKNGLIVGACNKMIDDIGGYRRIGLFLVNKSMVNIDLDPSQVEIYSMKKGKRKDFEKVTFEEYNNKIKKYVLRNSIYPSSIGTTNVNANLGVQVFNDNSNTVKDFQARICRMRKLEDGTRMQSSEKAPQDLGYLERTTVHPGEVVFGQIYTDDAKNVDLFVNVKINGIDYLFEWNDSKK